MHIFDSEHTSIGKLNVTRYSVWLFRNLRLLHPMPYTPIHYVAIVLIALTALFALWMVRSLVVTFDKGTQGAGTSMFACLITSLATCAVCIGAEWTVAAFSAVGSFFVGYFCTMKILVWRKARLAASVTRAGINSGAAHC